MGREERILQEVTLERDNLRRERDTTESVRAQLQVERDRLL